MERRLVGSRGMREQEKIHVHMTIIHTLTRTCIFVIVHHVIVKYSVSIMKTSRDSYLRVINESMSYEFFTAG